MEEKESREKYKGTRAAVVEEVATEQALSAREDHLETWAAVAVVAEGNALLFLRAPHAPPHHYQHHHPRSIPYCNR